jgi:hypothetical protein
MTRATRTPALLATGRADALPRIPLKGFAMVEGHEPSVTVTADGTFRPVCATDGCINEHASNYRGVTDEQDALEWAATLIDEVVNGPSDDDPRLSEVTRGWMLA